MKIIKAIKRYIIKTHCFNLVTARIHQKKRREELEVLMADKLKKYNKEPIRQYNKERSEYVWICWWQGEEHMTPIVKECYRRICIYNQDKNVVLITEKNLEDWIIFPEYIWEKYQKGIITKTHFSDLLRTELLKKYGGAWLDITLFTYSGIPDEFYEYPVYTGRFPYNKFDYNVSKNRWTSFFWVSRYPGNILFEYMSDFWMTYWKDKNDLIEYFLIDYALDLGYKNIPIIREELDKIPINGCGTDVWSLLNILSLPYDETVLKDIENKNWMQKLTYKVEEHIQAKAINPENSIYKNLFLEEIEE